jgi:hypothetical protein
MLPPCRSTRVVIGKILGYLPPSRSTVPILVSCDLVLASVVAGVAEASGAITHVYDSGDVREDVRENKWVPRVALVARSDKDFGVLASRNSGQSDNVTQIRLFGSTTIQTSLAQCCATCRSDETDGGGKV